MTRLIVGLGNPGTVYDHTRHNVGFRVVDALADSWNVHWKSHAAFHVQITETVIDGEKHILLKPQTFMNASGRAVWAIMNYYELTAANVTLVYDDKDLPFGTVRERHGGGSAGHLGVESVIAAIGPEFTRIRVGVANEHIDKKDTADFVLEKFSEDEEKQLPGIIDEAIQQLDPSCRQPR